MPGETNMLTLTLPKGNLIANIVNKFFQLFVTTYLSLVLVAPWAYVVEKGGNERLKDHLQIYNFYFFKMRTKFTESTTIFSCKQR